ncbi:MAG: asparaginase domain-containing protein [Bacteroidota bacterium]
MIEIITTGGTIDKVYYDNKNDYQVGDPFIVDLLKKMNFSVDYSVKSLMRIDSLDMTIRDRNQIYEHIKNLTTEKILITHGTDTIIDTALFLKKIINKTIVLTGSLKPALFIDNDATFNIGCALTAVQTLEKGIYIVMNGRIFNPEKVTKNIEKNIFESKD